MENETLKIFAAGNHSFTGIVNHTRQDLRQGKNSGFLIETDKASQLNRLMLFLDVVR
jgi:hypothetical protein